MSLIEKSIGIGEAEYLAAINRADKAESELFALGVQVAALKERLKLAEACVGAARNVLNEVLAAIEDDAGHDEPWFVCPRADLVDALAAFDAVPGDVSGKPTAYDVLNRRAHRVVEAVETALCAICHDEQAREILRAARDDWYAVPGDVAAMESSYDDPLPNPPDPRPRYASGEVPMVGDVVEGKRTYGVVEGFDIEGDVVVDGNDKFTDCLTLVRRAAPPANKSAAEVAFGNTADLLARAVALLREHQYDVRVRDFLADFDKGGV
jgi:hypothetical protein